MSSFQRKIFGVLALLLIAAILTAGALLIYPHLNQIVTAISPQPEKFTELYFEQHQSLPKLLKPGENFKLAFTINNLEYETVEYPIVVTIQDQVDSSKIQTLHTETLTLRHDEKKTINLDLTLPDIFPDRAKISVRLVKQNQTIHFWLNPPAQPSPTATSHDPNPVIFR